MAFDLSTAKPVKNGGFDLSTAKPVAEQPQEEAPDSILDDALDVAGEFSAGAVRTVADVADFLADIQPLGRPAQNRILSMLGVDAEIPSLRQLLQPTGVEGGFMEEGLPRDIVRAAGETVPAALGAGQAVRTAAQRLPQQVASESTATGLLREAGRSTAGQDVAAGVLSAAGAEVGEELGGETGRMIGATVAPLAGGVVAAGAPVLRESRQVARAVREAVPERGQIKQAARNLYRQVDDLGVTVDSEPLRQLSRNAAARLDDAGFDEVIHPRVAAALRRMDEVTSQPMSIGEIDRLRRVARSAASSVERDEQRLGNILLDQIDDFVGNLPRESIRGASPERVAPLLREARGLWRRARNSEIIDDAIERARNQASGFENGMRIQFRQILNNPKRRRSFNTEELDAMRRVVRGGPVENIVKGLGKFGFTDQQGAQMLLPSLGSAGGFAAGGGAGAVAVPVIGTIARRQAEALTGRNVELANQLVRAGSDASRIARAYLRTVPKNQRSMEELTYLLISNGRNFNTARNLDNRLAADAAFLASVLTNASDSDDQSQQQLPE